MLNIIVVYSMENTGKENILLTNKITTAEDITQKNIKILKSVPVFAKCLEKHEKKCTDGDCHKGGHLKYIKKTFANVCFCIYQLVKLFSPKDKAETKQHERILSIMSQMKVEDLGGKKYFKIKNLKKLIFGTHNEDIKEILMAKGMSETIIKRKSLCQKKFKFVFFPKNRISIYFVIALLSIVSGGFLFLLIIKKFNILPSMRFKICNLRNKHAYFLAVLVLLVLVKFIAYKNAYKNYVNKLEDINKKNLNKINDYINSFTVDYPRIYWDYDFSLGAYNSGDIFLCDETGKKLTYFGYTEICGEPKTFKRNLFKKDFNVKLLKNYPASNFFDYNNYYNNPNIDIIETQTSDIITMIITIVLFVIYIFICWWCWRKSPENPQKHSKGQGKVSAFRRVMYSR